MQTLHNQRYMIMWRQEGVAPLLTDFARSRDLARVLSGTSSKKFDIDESLGLPRDPQCPLWLKAIDGIYAIHRTEGQYVTHTPTHIGYRPKSVRPRERRVSHFGENLVNRQKLHESA